MNKSNTLRVGATFYCTASILVAQAKVLRDGLSVAIQVGFYNLIIEGVSKIIIQALDETIQIPWQIQYITNDTLSWRNKSIPFTTKQYLPRSKHGG